MNRLTWLLLKVQFVNSAVVSEAKIAPPSLPPEAVLLLKEQESKVTWPPAIFTAGPSLSRLLLINLQFLRNFSKFSRSITYLKVIGPELEMEMAGKPLQKSIVSNVMRLMRSFKSTANLQMKERETYLWFDLIVHQF